jgi:EAL domain-containing protein (putative c-di-GMP-specific phosphodiesterase class I)
MDVAGTPLDRLVARLPGLAALCLDVGVGSVRLQQSDGVAVRTSARPGLERLTGVVETLDGVVWSRGLPHVVEDLSRDPALTGDATGSSAGQNQRGTYAGVPVRVTGRVVGVLSAADPAGRPLGPPQVRILIELARLLAEQLELVGDARASTGPDEAVAEIAAAVAAGEIRPWYQPMMDLASGEMVGVEALARWHRPSGEVEGPASFLPLAERSELVLEIDRAVMAHAFADLAGWQRLRPDFRISVNLSGRHLDRPDTLGLVDAAAAAAGIAATSVDLEITETARPDDLRTSLVLLTGFRNRGYTVWFDDFGSGWSALQDLIRLPVGGIKLDRSFAEQLGTPVDDALVGALASAASQVGLKVTIEGIQTPLQLDRARALGCHFAQGYLWSPPIPAAEITQRLSATRG